LWFFGFFFASPPQKKTTPHPDLLRSYPKWTKNPSPGLYNWCQCKVEMSPLRRFENRIWYTPGTHAEDRSNA
jgi:hypothetical protein